VLTRLDHIVIAVRDLAAATGVAERLLGRNPSWRGNHATYGTANTLFRLENTYVELLAAERQGSLASMITSWLDQHGEGLFALALATDNAVLAADALRRRGLEVADPLEGSGTDSESGAERSWRNVFLPTDETRGVQLFVIEHLSPLDRLPPAAPRGAVAATVDGVDHVVVSTTDADASSRIYGETLGLRLALDKRFEQWGMRLLFFRVGGITVELAARLDGGDPQAPDRLWGISYRSPDVAAARERLAREGFDVSEVRPGRRPGTQVCTVRGLAAPGESGEREAGVLGVQTLVIGPA